MWQILVIVERLCLLMEVDNLCNLAMIISLKIRMRQQELKSMAEKFIKILVLSLIQRQGIFLDNKH
jgi:hypothetical protein